MATAYTPQTLYGYRINSNLTDVVDKELVLERLGLNIGDLDVIRGASSEDGAVRNDLIAISGLDTPIYKIVDRYQSDTSQHKVILDGSAGVDSTLRGNLSINGAAAGSGVRFRYVDDTIVINLTSYSGLFRLNEKVTGNSSGAVGVVTSIVGSVLTLINVTGLFSPSEVLTGSFSAATANANVVTPITEIKSADISTSRVSAWSGGAPLESDPVFYGGQIKVINGGRIDVNQITWGQRAQPRLVNPANGSFITGEVPTHVITTTINNTTVKLYAMKSIPLKFRGSFRRFDGTVEFNSAAGAKVSWRVVNVNSPVTDTQLYAEFGTANTSRLQYNSPSAALRDIEIYYHPDFITSLSLPSINLSEVPAASLPALTSLSLPSNELKDFPDFKKFSPNVENLQISRNNFHLGTAVNLRKFTAEVANRIPTSVTRLGMHGTYFGSFRTTTGTGGANYPYGDPATPGSSSAFSVLESACPNLQVLEISRGAGPFFSPDEFDPLCFLPTVPASISSYFATSNDFRRVPDRGLKDRLDLVNFYVNGNGNLEDPSFSLLSQKLVNVFIGSTRLPMPNLSNRTSLQNFESQYSPNAGSFYESNDPIVSEGTYKFSGCSDLRALYMFGGGQTGFLPKFKGNVNLNYVDLYAAQAITGGRPNNGEHGNPDGSAFVMFNDHFEDARKIGFFRVLSSSLLVGKGFEADTFKNLTSLYYLFWYSYGRTGSGTDSVQLPNISTCRNLRFMIMPVNNFTGPVPTMATNPNIFHIELNNNRLSGPVPTFSDKFELVNIFLHNNNLTSFSGFDNCRKLRVLHLNNNQITGNIPLLGGPTASPNLSRVVLFSNQFSGYTIGSFTNLPRLSFLDISNNQLTESDLNFIVDDLFDNYQAAPRGGLNINLRAQSRAVGYNPSAVGSDREKAVREKITFLQSKGWIITIG